MAFFGFSFISEVEDSSHEPTHLKRYIHDPAERYRQSVLVNPELTFDSYKNKPPGVKPAVAAGTPAVNGEGILVSNFIFSNRCFTQYNHLLLLRLKSTVIYCFTKR